MTRPRLRLTVGQVVCWQIAGVLGLAAIDAPQPRAWALAVASVTLLAPTAIRLHGRWAHQWLWLWLTLRLRARVRWLGGDVTPESALLSCVDGASAISETTVDGTTVAIVEHTGGLTAVLELGSDDQPLGLGPTSLPSPAALLPDGPHAPLTTVQLLTQIVPAPSAELGNAPAAVSYRQLTGGGVPSRRHAWLAVQVLRTPDALPGEQQQALCSVLRGLVRRLRRDLPTVRALDEAGLRAAVATAAHLDLASAAAGGDGVTAVERWDAWWTGDVPQATFHLNGWPGRASAGATGGALAHALLGTDCLAVTISFAVRRAPVAAGDVSRSATEDDRVAVQLTARLAAPDAPTLAAVAGQLERRLSAAHAVAERLDGRHLHGLAATLPLGGFLP